MITTAGTSYERSSIQRWLDRQATGAISTDPKTGTRIDSTTLTPNQALRAAIDEWKDQKQQELLTSDIRDTIQHQMQPGQTQGENKFQQDAAAAVQLRQEQDAEYEAALAHDLMLAAAATRHEEATATAPGS